MTERIQRNELHDEEKMRNAEAEEFQRLIVLYKPLPPKRFAIAYGLIEEAARLKVRLDILWDDIAKNGEWEWFTQSDKTEPYRRESVASKQANQVNKNYQAIIKQLDAMLPAEDEGGDELDAFIAE